MWAMCLQIMANVPITMYSLSLEGILQGLQTNHDRDHAMGCVHM